MPRRPLLLTWLALFSLIGVVADLGWRAYTRPSRASFIHREFMGTLRLAKEAGADLAMVELEQSASLADKLPARRVDSWERLTLTSRGETQRAVGQSAAPMTSAYAIIVDGAEVVAVPDEATARAVKEQILEEYRLGVLGEKAAVEQLGFKEQFAWSARQVRADQVKSADEAISILKYGTDKVETYVVKAGDTAWDIARLYRVETSDVQKANPTVNVELLQIGQPLVVTFREPYVHTESVSTRVALQGIPFTEEVIKDPDLWPWQYQVVTPGVWGQRELTLREHRDNGRLVKTEVLENKVLRAPKQQVARQGTKQIPALGTGQLVYPVVGQTTSHFGPRWGRYHEGIDIAAVTGTPVLAADSGMVVFRGWYGNYGNLIRIDHGEGKMVTWYAHLNGFNANVGDTVKRGDVIGWVGNTGLSTGPHLHFEVRVNGTPVNPLNFYQ